MKVGEIMSLKSIELQVAIPRTHDAGKMQEQMTKQSQQFQDTLTKQQLREELIKRGKVNEYEHVKHLNVKDEEKDKNNEEQEEQKKRKQDEKKQSELEHPYLGTKIDFSG